MEILIFFGLIYLVGCAGVGESKHNRRRSRGSSPNTDEAYWRHYK